MTPLERLLQDHADLRAVHAHATTPLEALFDVELASVAQAVEKRRWEFTAGRHCARAALHALGCPRVPIARTASGAAHWPEGYVGSITHTGRGDDAWAAAVVAPSSRIRALGIDAERLRPFKRELWRRVLIPAELGALEQLAGEPAQSQFALATFSAKEAAYKCQASLSGQFMSFEDFQVEWEPAPIAPQQGHFSARFLRDVGPRFSSGSELRGHYLVAEDLVITLVVLGCAHV